MSTGVVGGQIATKPDAAEAVGPITLQLAASGLSQPVGIAHAGDGRLFIVEKGGLVRIFNGSAILPTPFINLSSLIPASPGFEEGLLGLAFHPDYPATPYFFVHYTNASSDVVIARYEVSSNPNVANPSSARILRTITHPTYQNHNGGQMAFGQDGYLYVAIGDGGGMGDPGNNGQNINTYLGKILRLDVDQNVGTPPYYGIPPSNPFVGATPGLDEIWAFGLRNPWRFSFDRTTGDLLIADVGQGAREEIDFELNSSPGGVNYGWRIMEGNTCHINEGVGCFHASLTGPVVEYDHSAGDCSVTGGYMYRGVSPGFVGNYIYADFCTGRIWSAAPGPWSPTLLLDSSFQISSFGEDVNGELYLADFSGGTLQRLLLEDQDGDSLADQVDNCPQDANPMQENADANFVDNSPPYGSGVDDLTGSIRTRSETPVILMTTMMD
jgi:glucose/arabinose dehydrogenase